MTLATPHQQRHNSPVPFNSGTGLGGPNTKADSRRMRHFLRPSYTIGTSSMSGRGGRAFVLAGSFVPVRQSCHVLGTPLGGEESSFALTKETCPMSSIALRAVRALFPVFSVPVTTVPTQTEACAMARLLVSQGRRATVAPAAQGFTVSEVKA